jgi:RHS repeat-associated protein
VIPDPVGVPLELRDPDGKIVWSARLSAWGKRQREGPAIFTCPIRFQGQYWDAETGLHYNRFRYYDPATARYISPDPIGLVGGLNFFTYAPNPLSWIDPLGLHECTLEEEEKLREDAHAIASQFDDEQAKRRTVATSVFVDPVTGERMHLYAVSGDNITPSVSREAEARGYTFVPMQPGGPTHAEQILMDHQQSLQQQGKWMDATIAPSRPACGSDRADCSGRAQQEGVMILNPR